MLSGRVTCRGENGVSTTKVPEFGVLLQRYPVVAGVSQEELAERAELSRRGISDLERGVRRARYPVTVCCLAQALNLTLIERAALLTSSHASTSGVVPGLPLPLPLTSFVGREHQLGAVRAHTGLQPAAHTYGRRWDG